MLEIQNSACAGEATGAWCGLALSCLCVWAYLGEEHGLDTVPTGQYGHGHPVSSGRRSIAV